MATVLAIRGEMGEEEGNELVAIDMKGDGKHSVHASDRLSGLALCSGQNFTHDFGMPFCDTDKRLGGSGRGAATLLPFLESTQRNAQCHSKLSLRQASLMSGLYNVIGLDVRDTRSLGGLHFAHGLKKLLSKGLARRDAFGGWGALSHFRFPFGLP